MPTAAVVIIGNEILTGKFPDENGPYLIRRLRGLGCDLQRLVVVSDSVGRIAEEVRRCAAEHDFVFTTGGVGPTHDDVTFEAVAAAFGVPLVREERLVAFMREYEIAIDETTLRMARVPQGCELVSNAASSYPVMRLENVYVFPGVPKLMHTKFEALADRFAGTEVHTARLFTSQRETEIATILHQAQQAHPAVDIGSYPRFGEGPYRVIVTLESRDPAALAAAESHLRGHLALVEPKP